MSSRLNSDSSGLWAEQDVDSFLDYSIDWSDWLAQSAGDSIEQSTWTADAALTLNTPGVNGAITSVWVQGGQAYQWYALINTVISKQGRRDQRTIRLYINNDEGGRTGSALFPNPEAAIARMRRDRLLLLASSSMPSVEVSDDYLWEKIQAAESKIAHELRVSLCPKQFFPLDPTQAQIDALNGKPWDLDPAYDWEPETFLDNKWGYLVLRNKPVVDVSSIKICYPSATNVVLDIPKEWIRIDKKYGHINFVPSSPMAIQSFGALLMPALSGGRRLPFSVHVTYTAGLQNVQRDYPELIDVVFKMASLGIIEDSFLPQSGSISADGLSQSLSVDSSKYHDSIDRIINGADGSNGGLMAKIHGIRTVIL